MAWNPYLDYTLNSDVNARQWAVLPLSYTASSTCAECHADQQARLTSASHEGIGCQSCHGAAPRARRGGRARPTAPRSRSRVPDGRGLRPLPLGGRRAGPPSFRQIVPGQHYVSSCLECHDPHTGIANRPPVVLHPLEDLPPCLTCHGPEGFKARNQRHPAGSEDDDRCLECHAAGRGPAEREDAHPQVSP